MPYSPPHPRLASNLITRRKQNWIDRAFVLLLAALCTGLTVLQYRWTGEISRAELSSVQGGLEEKTRQLCRTIDAEISASCMKLLPDRSELEELGRREAHLARLEAWLEDDPQPVFRRIGYGFYVGEELQLFLLDPAEQIARHVSWPEEWESLEKRFKSEPESRAFGPGNRFPPQWRAKTGPPWQLGGRQAAFDDPSGRLSEIPLPEATVGGPLPAPGWMFFELDFEYLFKRWVPELLSTHLSRDGQVIADFSVKEAGSPWQDLLYTNREGSEREKVKPVLVRFNPQGMGTSARRRGDEGRWVAEVRPRAGVLEAMVEAARRRNLAVAGGLNVMILATGIVLMRYTRRARLLAERQMSFVASVSHELRTPLTVIRGAAHNLRRGVVKDAGRVEQYASLIEQHAEQLGDMVEQVLGIAGVAKNLSSAVRQPVALDEVLRDAVTVTAHETEAAHCQVELDLPVALPAVSGDPGALKRVFQNLIANAAKHGGAGGWIGIRAAAVNGNTPGRVEVCVSDKGPGIPAAEQEDIFKPFVRGARAQAAQIRGSGIGLSLVREIVEAHGGKVSVSSESGGTSFLVSLPIPLSPA